MRIYLITTGSLFGLMAMLHVWRTVAAWPAHTPDPGFILGMGALIALPGVLSWWAWRLLRSLPDNPTRGVSKEE